MSNKIGRRDFLGTVALVGAAAAAAGRTSLINSAEAATATSDDITSASAGELADAIRSKKLSSRMIVEAHLERIAKVNPKLNAVVQLTAEAAQKEADEADAALARGEIKGPLHGVPITIKDTLETTGVICTGGTKGRANFVPKADATAVARLRAAGGIILGKTNVPELAASAPMLEAVSVFPRTTADSRRSSRPRAAFRGPDSFPCRWARAIRCFTSA